MLKALAESHKREMLDRLRRLLSRYSDFFLGVECSSFAGRDVVLEFCYLLFLRLLKTIGRCYVSQLMSLGSSVLISQL